MSACEGFSLGSITCSDSVVLVPGGDLTAAAAPVLRARLGTVIDAQGCRNVTVDLQRVAALDPLAVEVLVQASTRLTRLGGTLALDRVRRPIAATLGHRLRIVEPGGVLKA